MSASKKEKSIFEKVLEKYSISEFTLILPEKQWKEILLKGNTDKSLIFEILNSSKYLMDEKTESWRRLWNYRDLEDNEFKKYVIEVDKKFYKSEYKDQGKLLHVIALLLYFSKSKMYKDTQKNIIKQAKLNIQNCIENEKWDTIEYDIDFGGSAYSLGFYDRASKNMQKILKYFKKEIQNSFNNQLEDKAKELLADIKDNNLVNLEKKLLQEFYRIPIMSKVIVDDFVLVMQNLEHKNIYDINQNIKKRYESTSSIEDILAEEKFWKSVNSKLLKDLNKEDSPVKVNLLNSLKKYLIKDILQSFQDYKKWQKDIGSHEKK